MLPTLLLGWLHNRYRSELDSKFLSRTITDVRFWHIADISVVISDVRFWGKADIG